MKLEEKKELCSKAFVSWFYAEMEKVDMSKHDKDVTDIFTTKVILAKLKTSYIDVILPDMLLLILGVCVEGNPGYIQIITKELLMSIKKNKGRIPHGYVVTTSDFTNLYATSFPIVGISEVDAKYESLWIGQKIEREQGSLKTDNLCDTLEWWQEIYK